MLVTRTGGTLSTRGQRYLGIRRAAPVMEHIENQSVKSDSHLSHIVWLAQLPMLAVLKRLWEQLGVEIEPQALSDGWSSM